MEIWLNQINSCRLKLIHWSRNKFRMRQQQIHELVDLLDELQQQWEDNAEQIKDLSIKVDKLWEHEEGFWQQRS